MHDIDNDGVEDIVVATYDGEIFFFRDNGEQIDIGLRIPALPVNGNWYQGEICNLFFEIKEFHQAGCKV